MKKTVHAVRTSKPAIPLVIVMVLFFLCGFSTVLNSILIPYLQHTLQASYTLANFIPVSFYVAYFIFSPSTAYCLKFFSYVAGMRVGIIIAAMGSCLLSFAASTISFPLILVGIFFLGGGVAILQVTGNPYALHLGSLESGSKRMVMVHGVTALGMIIAPIVGSHYILGYIPELPVKGIGPLGFTYLSLMVAWILLYRFSYLLPNKGESLNKATGENSVMSAVKLFKDPVLVLGAIGITTSVGIEVTCSSFMIKYISSSKILDITLGAAGKWSIAFWIAFTIGRFTGTVLLNHIREDAALLIHACLGGVFALATILSQGFFGVLSMIMLGFSASILFPVIFSITLQRAQSPQRNISAVLCMANIGGAIYPLTQGVIADSYGVHFSYVVPLFGFGMIATYVVVMSSMHTKSLVITK